ncbi:MAG: response regulator [Myxococcota bacterium]
MSTKTVTIIDADTQVTSQVEQSFAAFGFRTLVLGEGDPVEFVRANGPRLILLNVELPGASGYSLCNRLKRQQDLSQIPIILTSQEATPEAFAEHSRTKTPADAYLRKAEAQSPAQLAQLYLDSARRLVPEAFLHDEAHDQGQAFQDALKAELSQELAASEPPAEGAVSPPVEGAANPPVEGEDAERAAPKGPPPLRKAKGRGSESEVPVVRRDMMRPSLKELLEQGRANEPPLPSVAGAGLEEKVTRLRESLRRKEQELARAGELWAEREREFAALFDQNDQNTRELERAKRAREDLLSQLTIVEDNLAALRADAEISGERSERLEREKKALSHELEEAHDELERTTSRLQRELQELQAHLQQEQAARASENDSAHSEIEELSRGLESVRLELAEKSHAFGREEQQLQGEISTLKGRLAEEEGNVQNLQGQVEKLTGEGRQLRDAVQTLKKQKATLEARLKANIDDLTARLEALEAEKSEVEQELRETKGQREELRKQYKEASARIVDLEGDVADGRPCTRPIRRSSRRRLQPRRLCRSRREVSSPRSNSAIENSTMPRRSAPVSKRTSHRVRSVSRGSRRNCRRSRSVALPTLPRVMNVPHNSSNSSAKLVPTPSRTTKPRDNGRPS